MSKSTTEKQEHRFSPGVHYRGDNVPLCSVCLKPESPHKFSPSTKQALIERIEPTLRELSRRAFNWGRTDVLSDELEPDLKEAIDAIAQAWLEDREKATVGLKADLARAMGHMEGCGHPDRYLLDRHPEFALKDKTNE